ncbi:MAG: BlaI/MecI/CopY family transcriptional regulator, partial [bacterium]
ARSALALGNLERAVMDTLWDQGEMSGNELFNLLGEKLKIRHNTLLTVCVRLESKGLVSKLKKGKYSYYSPLLSRDEFGEKVAGPLLKELMEVSSDSALAAFVDNASRDPDKLNYLKSLIEEAEKKKKWQ